jgi:hypothetical protein
MIVKIDHPKADEISIQQSEFHYCRPGISSEIAFFYKGSWVTEPIEPFADYHDGAIADTAVYSYVPNELIFAFLDENVWVPEVEG